MNAIDQELTAALDRRASEVVVEDGLDAILNDTALVRASAPQPPQRRSGLLAAAAAALIAVGGAGLVLATQQGDATPPASATADTDSPMASAPSDATAQPQTVSETEPVHLWMGDGWELTFADPNGYFSTWTATGRDSDDPDAEPSVPSIVFSNIDGQSTNLLDDLVPDSDVTIAGIETTLYSNQAGTLLVAIVPLNDAHTVQLAIENAPADSVSEILNSIGPMTEAEWTIAVDAQTSPTTTEVVRLDGN